MSSRRALGSVSSSSTTSSMKVGETTVLPNGLASMRSVRDSIEAERDELIQSRSTRSSMGNDSTRRSRSSGQSFMGTRVSGSRSLENETIREPDGTIISRRIETIEAPIRSSRASTVAGVSRPGTAQRSSSPRRSLSRTPTSELQSSQSSRRSRSLSREREDLETPEEIDVEEIDEIDYSDGSRETISRSTRTVMSPRSRGTASPSRSSGRAESPRSSEDEFTQRSLEKSEALRELLDELQEAEMTREANPSVSSRRRRSVSTRGIGSSASLSNDNGSYNPMTEIPPPRGTFEASASSDCGCGPSPSASPASRSVSPSSARSTIRDRTAVRSTSPSNSVKSTSERAPVRSTNSMAARPIDDLLDLVDEIGINNTIRGKEHRSIDVSGYSRGEFKITKSRSGPPNFDLLVSDNLENYQWALDDILTKRPDLTYNGVRLADVRNQLISEFQESSMSPRSPQASRASRKQSVTQSRRMDQSVINSMNQSRGQSATNSTTQNASLMSQAQSRGQSMLSSAGSQVQNSLNGVNSSMPRGQSSLSGAGSRVQNSLNSAGSRIQGSLSGAGSRVQNSLNSAGSINSSSISGRVSSSMNSMM